MKNLLLFLLSIIPVLTFGQYNVTGVANASTCNCFEISNDATPNTLGSFYNTNSIDLNTDFNLKFVVNFGCDPFGSEGLAFVMQTGPWTVGNNSYGLGYEGIANSLAIEFDTKDNNASGEYPVGADIPGDHIAIQRNGIIGHNAPENIAGPFGIIPGVAEAEDCNDHTVEIIWNAALQTIDVKVDGGSSFGGAINYDIINNVFGGATNVLWGWTGTAGITANIQTVCIGLEPEFTYTPTNCPGQQIDFTGSYWSNNTILNYQWDFDGLGNSNLQNPSFTYNTVGNHPTTLTITDNNGCSNSSTFEIGVGFNVNITADNLTVCPGGASQLNVDASPYVGNSCCFDLLMTDTWDGWGSNEIEVFIDGVSSGTYSLISPFTGQYYEESTQLCFPQGSAIQIVINGDQNPFENGYSLTDQNGTVIIEVLPGLTWTNGDTQAFTVDCGLTNVVYDYNWNADPVLSSTTISNPIATVPSTTTYTVNVTDPNTNCTISDDITITTYSPVTATLSGNTTVCQGNSGDLSVTFPGTGPFDISYTDPNSIVTSLTGIVANPYSLSVNIDGTYTLNTVSGNGCVGTVNGTAVLNEVIPPNVNIDASASYCSGDAITDLVVISTNGGTVNWYNNSTLTGTPLGTGNTFTPTITTTSITTYYAQEIETVSGLGCAGPSDNVTITINAIPNPPNLSGITDYCEGDIPTPLSAEMSLGGSPSWFNNATLTPPTVSTLLQYNPALNVGTFCYFVTETANGCTGSAAQICVNTKITPAAPDPITGNLTYCEGQTPTPLTATPNSAGNITWYNSTSTSLSTLINYTPDLTLGSQTFTVTETLNGCVSPEATVSITVNILPTVDIPETLTLCYGDSAYITATHNNFDLLWSNGSTEESDWIGPYVSSTIYITATNPLCGSVMDSIMVTINSLPYINAGNDTVIGIGGEATLWAYGTPTFTWTPSPDECITENCSEIYVIPNQATVYIVEGIDANSCKNYDTVLVDISGYMEVFIPNIFSPNGDEHNDYLVINGPRLFNFNLEIFDRWGKLVFVTDDQKDYWDGKYKGTALETQTFVYQLTGETVLKEKINISGNVTLIK